MSDQDQDSHFLLVVDTRDPSTQGVKRVSRLNFAVPNPRDAHQTGMGIIDAVLDSDQSLTLDDFLQYYQERGVDIHTCFSVETNKLVERAERYNELPLAQIGYLAMFKKIDQLRQGGLSYIFAAINQDSIDSFRLIDLQDEPLAGRDDIRTPDGEGGFDAHFYTVALPTTEHNLNIFTAIAQFSAPEIDISGEH